MVFQVLTQPYLIAIYLKITFSPAHLCFFCLFLFYYHRYLSQEWGKEWQQKAPVRFVEKALYPPRFPPSFPLLFSPLIWCRYAAKEKPDQEVVILSQILAADINVTYQQYVPNIVTHANNMPIKNLRHLVEVSPSFSHFSHHTNILLAGRVEQTTLPAAGPGE